MARKVHIRTSSHSIAPFRNRSLWTYVLSLPYAAGLFWMYLVSGILKTLLVLCHAAGLGVYQGPRWLWRRVRLAFSHLLSDAEKAAESLPGRLARLGSGEFTYNFFLLLAMCGAIVGLLRAGGIFAEGLDVRNRILGNTHRAISSLEQGKNKLLAENPEAAERNFVSALRSFQNGREQIQNSNLVIKGLLNVLPQGKDATYLLKAGQFGSQAVLSLSRAMSAVSEGDWSPGSLGMSRESVLQVRELLGDVARNLEAANAQATRVSPSSLPADKQQLFKDTQTSLAAAGEGARLAARFMELLGYLAEGEKRVLLLLQNSNELRPSGGFLGTYGAFFLQSGKVQSQNISSIYDLDGQLKEVYVPPLPMFAVNNRWFMRDANWFAAFPESAESVMSFYEEIEHRTPDMVIAVTPQLVTRLLAVTGPIAVPGFGVTLDSDNFVELTQVETSVHYDHAENKPKKMLAEFLPIFFTQIKRALRENLPGVLGAVQESVSGRDIQMYSRDRKQSELISQLGLDGRLHEDSRDYLDIVFANLGGTKTDLSMRQEVSLVSDLSPDGSVINTLRVVRTNPLPHISGLANRGFVRFLVPEGSQLLSSKGFSFLDVESAKLVTNGLTHPKVAAWEKGVVKQLGSGTLVGEEAGKTFFGGWLNVEGGQKQSLELVYKLPFKLGPLDRHSLLVQKQPGSRSSSFRYQFNFAGRRLVWSTEPQAAGSSASREFDLDRDRFTGFVVSAE